MIALTVILVAVVLALAFFVFLKLLKTVFKAVFAVMLLLLFVIAVFGIVLYIDYVKLKGTFEEDQLILLSHDEKIVAGFIFSNDRDTEVLESDRLNLLSREEIIQMNEDLADEDYKKDYEHGLTVVLESSYFIGKSVELVKGKSIIINESIAEGVFSCTKLSNCTAVLVNAAPDIKKQIENSFEDEQDVKNKLFFNLFVQETKETKGTFLVTAIKDGTVTVYPEILTLKLIKMLPEKTINKILKTGFSEGSEPLNETESE